MDLLAPGVGEICGGSLREERLDLIRQSLAKSAFSQSLDWSVSISVLLVFKYHFCFSFSFSYSFGGIFILVLQVWTQALPLRARILLTSCQLVLVRTY